MTAELLLKLLAIGLSNGAIIALNAIAVTLVYGAVRMINFAHGDMFALTTVLATTAVTALGLRRGMPPLALAGGMLVVLAAAVALAVAISLLVERAAFRPFRDSSRLAPLIAGIGISFMLYQAALLWRKTEPTWIPGEHRSVPGVPEVPRGAIPDLLPDTDLLRAAGLPIDVRYTARDLLVLALAVALAAGMSLFLRRTRAGRALRARAQDPEMAALCGVNRARASALAFVLGGALAGVAAFVFVVYYSHPFTLYGAQSGLTAFGAAVLGGIGSPVGALAGGLLFGILSSFSDYFLAARWTPVLLLLVLIMLLLIRPARLRLHSEGESSATVDLVAGGARLGGWARPLVVAVALAAAYPLLDSLLGLRQQVIVTAILIYALMAVGLTILLGFAGFLDLGYAACFALGSYTAGLLTNSGSPLAAFLPRPLDFLAVAALSALVAGLFGAINGAMTLRMHPEALAIATLAFGQIVARTFVNLDQWTSGSRGISALPAPVILGVSLDTPVRRYVLALAVLGLVLLISRRLLDSRIGRAWRAMSEDAAAAASSGVSLGRSRLFAFAFGAALAGVAGALFASIFSYVDPDVSDFRLSAMALAMVVIGGAGSLPGAILGAFVIAGLDQIVIPRVGVWTDAAGGVLAALDVRSLSFLCFGLALYLTVLLRGRRRPPCPSAVRPPPRRGAPGSVEAPEA
jgi:branched-chain amino acid transport system permease protein